MTQKLPPPDPNAEIRRLWPRLCSFAVGLMKGTEGAEDIVQEACKRATEKWASYSPGQAADPVYAWLCGFVVNVHREWKRKQRPDVSAAPRAGHHDLSS